MEMSALLRVPGARLDDAELVATFEGAFARYVGRSHCVAFPKARTAVWCALRAADLPAGSGIVMPPVTIKPMLDVVSDLGLRPVFVDLEIDGLGWDPVALEAAMTPDVRALLPTWLYGVVPDLERLERTWAGRDLFVVEDFSHNLNASGRHRRCGTIGQVSVYSSSTIKTLDTWGGGLAVTDDSRLAGRLRGMRGSMFSPHRAGLLHTIAVSLGRAVATDRRVFAATAWPLLQWARRSHPDLYRWLSGYVEDNDAAVAPIPTRWLRAYSAPQARAGLNRLPLVARSDEERRANARKLMAGLEGSGLRFPVERPGARNSWWQLVGIAPNGGGLIDALAEQGVDSATTNLDLLADTRAYPTWRGRTPNARLLANNGVFLPCWPGLEAHELQRVVRATRRACRSLGWAS